MNNQGFSFQLPGDFCEIRKLLLVPSASMYREAKEYIRCLPESRHTFRSAPLLADCFSPFFINSDTLLIGPFLGADGISYAVNLLLGGKVKPSVYLLGYGGAIIHDASDSFPSHVSDIDWFYSEDRNSRITQIKSSTNKNQYTILSTPCPLHESLQKIKMMNQEYGINLIDMECAFIKKECDNLGADFHPTIHIRDIWNLDQETHTIIKKPSRSELHALLASVVTHFKNT